VNGSFEATSDRRGRPERGRKSDGKPEGDRGHDGFGENRAIGDKGTVREEAAGAKSVADPFAHDRSGIEILVFTKDEPPHERRLACENNVYWQ
jgi:hypothetical protein